MIGIKTYSINKDYEFERNLGYGSYGEVKLGKHRKTNRAVAIKKIPLQDQTPEVMEMITNEIFILIHCVFNAISQLYRITLTSLTSLTPLKIPGFAILWKSK